MHQEWKTLVKTYHLNQDYDLRNQMSKVSPWKHSPVLTDHAPAEAMLGWNRVSTDSGKIRRDVAKADIEMKNCWYNCLVNTVAQPQEVSCYPLGI